MSSNGTKHSPSPAKQTVKLFIHLPSASGISLASKVGLGGGRSPRLPELMVSVNELSIAMLPPIAA